MSKVPSKKSIEELIEKTNSLNIKHSPVKINSIALNRFHSGNTLRGYRSDLLSKNFFSFPNPTENNSTITINLENGQNRTLEVFEINGKTVMQKNVVGQNGEINLDITVLNEGVYIYIVNGQTNRFVKK